MSPVPPCWPDAEALAGRPRGPKSSFAPLVETASGAFGFVVAPTREAVRDIQGWMQRPGFRLRVVVDLYPTCPTRQADLEALRELVAGLGEDRLAVHVIARDGVGDRGTNALLLFDETLGRSSVVIGPTDDLGRAPAGIGQVNMAFDADSDLVEAFRKHFELAWKRSVSILTRGTTSIPLLALPPGTEAGVRAWEDYLAVLSGGPQTDAVAASEPANPASVEDGPASQPEAVHAAERDPLGALSLPALDEFAVDLSDLYRRGHVVVVDKHSRVPPLDAPIRPSLLGEEAEAMWVPSPGVYR